MTEQEQPDPDLILEDPMTVREFEVALRDHLSRSQRRLFWRALRDAGLVVFRA